MVASAQTAGGPRSYRSGVLTPNATGREMELETTVPAGTDGRASLAHHEPVPVYEPGFITVDETGLHITLPAPVVLDSDGYPHEYAVRVPSQYAGDSEPIIMIGISGGRTEAR